MTSLCASKATHALAPRTKVASARRLLCLAGSILQVTLVLADEDLCSWSQYRLPNATVPSHYDLDMTVNLAGTFANEGSVSIEAMQLQATRCIVMHADEFMTLNSIQITHGGKTFSGEASPANIELDGQRIIRFPELIPKGPITLAIAFEYFLRFDRVGFYAARYETLPGQFKVIAATQFEVPHARKGFPCFDEPALLATFSITTTTASDLTALSNTAEISTEDVGEGLTKHVYAETPSMSTYLVAFVVGELYSVETVVQQASGTEVAVRVFGTSPQPGQQIALDTAAAVLEGFEHLFEVEYLLTKLDLVGLPDFLAGGMENWGLLTFRENLLILPSEPGSTSIFQEISQTELIAHEIAHMWFGDLVALDWWSEVWVKEGMATYWQVIGSSIYRDFGQQQQLGTYLSLAESAKTTDASADTNPLSVNVTEGAEGADVIPLAINSYTPVPVSYNKGSAVLHMLREYLARPQADHTPSVPAPVQPSQPARAASQPAPGPTGPPRPASPPGSTPSGPPLRGPGSPDAAQTGADMPAPAPGPMVVQPTSSPVGDEAPVVGLPQVPAAGDGATASTDAQDTDTQDTQGRRARRSKPRGERAERGERKPRAHSPARRRLLQVRREHAAQAGLSTLAPLADPVRALSAARRRLTAIKETALRDDPFIAAVRTFLRKFAGIPVGAADLWDTFAASTGAPVAEWMETWTYQEGLPVVSAELVSGKLSLTQKRFQDVTNLSTASLRCELVEPVAKTAETSVSTLSAGMQPCLGDCVATFGRCGGQLDSGASFVKACCADDAVCVQKNQYYSQCIPQAGLARQRPSWSLKVQKCGALYDPGVTATIDGELQPWFIPVKVGVAGDETWTEFDTCRAMAAVPTDGAIKVNTGQSGYYRVNYSDDLWTRLQDAAQISDPSDPAYLTSVDFAGLLADSYALAAAGEASYSYFVGLLPALAARASGADNQDLPFATLQALQPLQAALTGSCRQQYTALIGNAVAAAASANDITFVEVPETDGMERRVLRSALAAIAAAAGVVEPESTAFTRQLLEFLGDLLEGGSVDASDLPLDVRQSVFTLALAESLGDDNLAFDVLKPYFFSRTQRTAETAAERRIALVALASVSEPATVQRSLLEVGLSDQLSFLDLSVFVTTLASRSQAGATAALNVLKESQQAFAEQDNAERGGAWAQALFEYLPTIQEFDTAAEIATDFIGTPELQETIQAARAAAVKRIQLQASLRDDVCGSLALRTAA